MTRFLTATALALVSAVPSYADLISAQSEVSSATVFPQGASVSRSLTFAAEAGQHSIVVDDLPLNFDARSLRVEGQGDAAFRIISVDHRITRLPPQDPTESPEYQAILAEIEALEAEVERIGFERRGIMTRIEVANGRLRMVEALMTREPQDMVDDVAAGGDPADWAATIEVLAQQMDIALVERLAAEQDLRPLDAQVAELQVQISEKRQELAASQLPAQDRSIATIEIAADAALEGALVLTYRVHDAGWAPVYDVRLSQGETASLALERHARIWQRTGEAWDDVALTLSTVRPSGRLAAPELPALVADLWDEDERVVLDGRMQTRVEQDLSAGLALEMEDALVPEVAAPVIVAAPVEMGIVTHGQTVAYVLPGLTDVDGDGTVRQAAIDADSANVTPSARSVPRIDPNAYLYATLENRFAGPILPGQASVYVDGAFVGDTALPLVAAGAEVTLPFGVIDGIAISSAVVDRTDGDYGLLSTTNTRLEDFRLSADSVLPYDIELTIYDRAPVSEDEDLEIEVTSSIPPSEEDVNGQRGVVAWTFDLPAGGSQSITFGYEMWWPGDAHLLLQ